MKRILFTIALFGVLFVSGYEWECSPYYIKNLTSRCPEGELCFSFEGETVYLCHQYAKVVDREVDGLWDYRDTFLFRINTDTKAVSEKEIKELVGEK